MTLARQQPRNFDGVGGLKYQDTTGRNDLVAVKVARDAKNIYFYVRTQGALSTAHADRIGCGC